MVRSCLFQPLCADPSGLRHDPQGGENAPQEETEEEFPTEALCRRFFKMAL